MLSVIDSLLDATVVPGFSRVGYALRSRGWQAPRTRDMRGKTVVVTGPTSGLGLATVEELLPTGARLVLVARNAEKLDELCGVLAAQRPDGDVVQVVADTGDLEQMRAAAERIASLSGTVDVLVHNAGSLLATRQTTSAGHETTMAVHVYGPHLLTRSLLSRLAESRGRVITVSSGGMYAAELPRFDLGHSPEMPESVWDGTRQYAIAKRVQVTLNEMWAERHPEVVFAAMHPGWADTPGVQDALPTFRRVTRPLLRTARQGADTVAWLAVEPELPGPNGSFWSDRTVRPVHRMPRTRRSDTPEQREALWRWVEQVASPG
jgi:NAD(P)-dependent dehydrogenase (short-subunit alcohol dehydrogenase family)